MRKREEIKEENKEEKKVAKQPKVKVRNQGKIIFFAVLFALTIILGSVYIFFGDVILKKENESKLEEPLSVELNEWETVSKYNEKTKENENVRVRITKVIFGAEAEAVVRSYAESNEFVDYEGVYQGMQLVVAEYEIDFSEYTKNKFGDTVKIDAKVLNRQGGNIETAESTYVDLPIRNISAEEKVSLDKTGVGYFEFQIPNNYENTALKIGAKDGVTKLFNIN